MQIGSDHSVTVTSRSLIKHVFFFVLINRSTKQKAEGAQQTWREKTSESSPDIGKQNSATSGITSDYADYCCYDYDYDDTTIMRAANIASVAAMCS